MLKNIIYRIFLLLFLPYGVYSQSEWKLHSNEGDSKLWVRILDNSGLKEFKIHTIIDGNIEKAYLLLRDVENMNIWYDKVKTVKLLKKINNTEAIYFLEYEIPFPFSNRISSICGKINFNATTKTINVSTDYYPYEIPKEKQDLVLITKIAGKWEIQQLGNGKLSIQHQGYMDPSGNLPIWLVNEGVTSGPFKTIKGFKEMLSN